MYVKKTVLQNEKQRHAWLNTFQYVIPGVVFRTNRECCTFPLHLLVKKPMVGSALWIHARWVLQKQTQRFISNADDECSSSHIILILFSYRHHSCHSVGCMLFLHCTQHTPTVAQFSTRCATRNPSWFGSRLWCCYWRNIC